MSVIGVLLFLLCYFTIMHNRQEEHIRSLERSGWHCLMTPIWLIFQAYRDVAIIHLTKQIIIIRKD